MCVYLSIYLHTQNKLHLKRAGFKTKGGEVLPAFYRWSAEGTGEDMSSRSHSTSVVDLETPPKPLGLTRKPTLLPGMERRKLIHRGK